VEEMIKIDFFDRVMQIRDLLEQNKQLKVQLHSDYCVGKLEDVIEIEVIDTLIKALNLILEK
jgi:hypothetical protein